MMYSEVDSQHDSPKDWGYFTGEFILKSLRKTCVFFELHVFDVISVLVLQPLTIMELDEHIRSQGTDFPPLGPDQQCHFERNKYYSVARNTLLKI